MPTPTISLEKQRRVKALYRDGKSYAQIAKAVGVAKGSVCNIVNDDTPVVETPNKKRGRVNWREWMHGIAKMQELRHEASWSQEQGIVKLGDGKSPVLLYPFSDQHLGAWGADHLGFERNTDELLKVKNAYMALVGDPLEFAIKMRSVLETTSQIVPPDMQIDIFEAWLDEVRKRVAFASWCNHGVEREEKQSGVSSLKRILSRNVMYFNGIGHVDVQVGSQVYKIAVSHVFKQGRSAMNPCAGQMRYMRFEGLDREIAIQGDTHKPGLIKYKDGPVTRCALNAGTLHTNSGYAKRYFSLFTADNYPCVVLYPNEHLFIPFWSLAEARKHLGE